MPEFPSHLFEQSNLAIEKLKRVEKLIQKLLDVFEQEDAIEWLNTSNQSLEGRTPLKEIMY
ncbi:MAG: MbcA/ParS/Xre antitoxin family protein, partial [Nanoarchaeota archaeon]|nr:MbcA/ParS/Xre antitoxin family protein [Nanoarchaeota archaeon]